MPSSPAADDDARPSDEGATALSEARAGIWWPRRGAAGAESGFYRLPENPLLRYGASVLLVAAAVGVSLLFRAQLGTQPSIPFFAVVVATAYLAGLGPALVATGLSVLAIEFIFFEPVATLAFNDIQDVTALLAFGGVALLVSWLADRTERSRKELAEQRRVAEETTRRALLLSEAGRLISEVPRYEEGLQQVAELLVREFSDYVVAYAVEDEFLRRVAVAHADPGQRSLVQRLMELRRPRLGDDHGVGATIRTGEPVLVREIGFARLEEAADGNVEYLELLRRLDPVSTVMLPLRARGRIVGGLALVASSHSGRRYDEGDLRFAQELGSRIAVTLDNARLLAEAQAATRARERVMAVVAHDLRNPLNVIVGAAELLENPEADVSRDSLARMLKGASHQAGELIDDLLDVSRMEAGEFHVSPEPVPVAELLRRVEASAELLAREKDVELDIRCGADSAAVYADGSRVQRLFANLLDNAFEVSPRGGRVVVAARGEDGEVLFSVEDDGPGIPERDLPYIFNQFWQGEKRDKGAGLGLAIVRGIVTAHGGRVWVDSVEGEGTRVCFTLPTAGAS